MKKNGFSLIELMIAVTIVAILAAIAVPSYSAYVRRANRSDATRTLSFIGQALERCYSQSFTYAACPQALPGTNPSAQGYYNVTLAVLSATTFNITAVPLTNPQLGDAQCTSFTVDQTGAQAMTGTADIKTCWGSS